MNRGKDTHFRNGFDVIQDHVKLSNNRLRKARYGLIWQLCELYMRRRNAGKPDEATLDQAEGNQELDESTISALASYLQDKAVEASRRNAPDFTTANRPNHRASSRVVYGLAVKLNNMTKLRGYKRRSGLKFTCAASPRGSNDKLTKRDSKNFREVQVATMLHRQRHGNPLELSEKVLSAFRAVAHLWLQRKQRREQAVKDNVTSKMVMGRRPSTTMSNNVFDIISKSFVTAVPALQFFDDSTYSTTQRAQQLPSNQTIPRGICYTMSEDGTRQCKTQHNMSDLAHVRGWTRSVLRSIAERHTYNREKDANKTVCLDDALLLSMNKRLKIRMALKKNRIHDISNAFNSHQEILKQKLVATLAMHWAEQENIHSTKLSVACANDTTTPSFNIEKDEYLSQLRYNKWRLRELCKLVSLFGALVKTSENTPGDFTPSELHVLSLFRILLDDQAVLTPVVLKGIMFQLSPTDMQCPRVQV
ncbi:hypothetical protein LEN26_001122 [Aphanomyces euteiches]|nr:hypothetical protein AeMF1_001260 [Aphanomyces euteiches]KAH9162033.1 hypothetical protein LEN26_001122 [Aphanomyces euteiches]KAH9189575.1 hypothetical protein AeNC1_008448 [Aphanomyces euteiches]